MREREREREREKESVAAASATGHSLTATLLLPPPCRTTLGAATHTPCLSEELAAVIDDICAHRGQGESAVRGIMRSGPAALREWERWACKRGWSLPCSVAPVTVARCEQHAHASIPTLHLAMQCSSLWRSWTCGASGWHACMQSWKDSRAACQVRSGAAR